jgi:antigen flippase
MGADFYPRLTACANDNPACNRMVNEQALVGLLLAGPGALATLTFAPAVIALFYTAKFGAAVEILRWICLGAALRVITWPMGFIILAKGRQTLFFWSDLICTAVYIALAIVCVRHFGLNGAGIAFFGLYVFHGLITYPIVHRLSGFRWSRENKQTGMLFLCLLSMVFCGFYVLPFVWAVGAGTVAAVLSGVYSLRTLLTLVSLDSVPRPIRRLLAGFGFAPAA